MLSPASPDTRLITMVSPTDTFSYDRLRGRLRTPRHCSILVRECLINSFMLNCFKPDSRTHRAPATVDHSRCAPVMSGTPQEGGAVARRPAGSRLRRVLRQGIAYDPRALRSTSLAGPTSMNADERCGTHHPSGVGVPSTESVCASERFDTTLGSVPGLDADSATGASSAAPRLSAPSGPAEGADSSTRSACSGCSSCCADASPSGPATGAVCLGSAALLRLLGLLGLLRLLSVLGLLGHSLLLRLGRIVLRGLDGDELLSTVTSGFA